MAISTFETITRELITPDMNQELALNALIGLRGRYEEPWRGYHTFEHPLELMDLLHQYGGDVEDRLAVGWANMYHDAILDPYFDLLKKGQNEERSAQLAESEIGRFSTRALAERVGGLIRTSTEHDTPADDPDGNFFIDADLWILGSPRSRYRRYRQGVKFEWKGVVPPETYRTGRISVLRGLVTRTSESSLYRTDVFREHFEESAQANVADEIEELTKEVSDGKS